MESSDDVMNTKSAQVNLGPFNLPPADPLPKDDLDKMTQAMMSKIFRRIDEFTATTPQKAKSGLNRLAASSTDRMAMLTNFIRLLTRPSAGLFNDEDQLDAEQSPVSLGQLQMVADTGRQQLLLYILHNWTQRMDIATAWLTEEWYNDLMCQQEFANEGKKGGISPPSHFKKWAHRFLDELSAFISHEHQNLLIRFVSEVPGLDSDLVNKVKRLALDPERVTMTVKAL
jgi:symplekin